jgi:3-hydroxyacyl-CoA dehydrogenase
VPDPLYIEDHGSVRLLRMDRPPANATGLSLRRALVDALRSSGIDSKVTALVLIGTGRFFSAGADIGELGTPDNQAEPRLRDVIDALESHPKPIVAAINGIAFGGGLELALGCMSRVALADARFALPEVKLGLIPGAGGTQRLPRLVGLGAAIDLITSGEPLTAPQAAGIGLIDEILPEPFGENAVRFAIRMATGKPAQNRVPDAANDAGRLLDAARARIAVSGPERRAMEAALFCLEAAARMTFEEGMRIEHKQVMDLIGSAESQALRQQFFEKRRGGRTC